MIFQPLNRQAILKGQRSGQQHPAPSTPKDEQKAKAPSLDAKLTFETLDRIFKAAGLSESVTGYHVIAAPNDNQKILLTIHIWDHRPTMLVLPQFFKTMRTIQKQHQQVKALKEQFKALLAAHQTEFPACIEFKVELSPHSRQQK